jgi:hypothetical protein
MALGTAAYQILSNIILVKFKPYIEKIVGDYQNGFRDGRSVIENIFALKIINKVIMGQTNLYSLAVQKKILHHLIKRDELNPHTHICVK